MTDSEVKTVEKKSNWWDAPSAKEKHKVEYKPSSSGFSLFTYKGKSFVISKFKAKPITVGQENKPHTEESITIMCRGGGKDLILDLIDHAIDYSIEQD